MKLFAPFVSVILSAILVTGPLQAQQTSQLQLKVLEDKGGALTIQVSDGASGPVSDAAVLVRLPDDGLTGAFQDGTRAAVAYSDSSGRASVTGIRWSDQPGKIPVQITATRGTLRGELSMDHVIAGAAPAPTPVTAAPVQQKPVGTAAATPVQQPGTPAVKMAPEPKAEVPSSLPRVTVSSVPSDERLHSGGGKKWILLAILAAGAGAGVAVMTKGKSGSSSSSTSSSGVTIGTPTIGVGKP